MTIRHPFSMDEVEAFWDNVAPVYEECNDTVSDAHYQRFRESIPYLELKKHSRILNIWSRTGLANKFMRERETSIEIINAELSGAMIQLAKTKFPDEHFEKIDLLNLPYADASFDEILSLETIEHVHSPLRFLEELHRVLKPAGKLVLSAPPATAEFALRAYELFFKNHGEGPHKFLSSETTKLLMQEAGFCIKKHWGTLLIPVGPRYIKRLGENIIERFQHTCIREFGIRQFYVCIK